MTSVEAKDAQRSKPCYLACRGCATVATVLGDVDGEINRVFARLEAGLELHTLPSFVVSVIGPK